MYHWEKEKSQKKSKHPSFSTTLLDEIYRSIDGFEEKRDEFEACKQRITHVANNKSRHNCPKAIKSIKVRNTNNNVDFDYNDDDEDVVSYRRACLVEKWMEQKVSDKVKKNHHDPLLMADFDNDPLFFSSGSGSSSDSSSGALSSSSSLSETEFIYSSRKSSLKTSCFSSSRPKPVRTSSKPSVNLATNVENAAKSETVAKLETENLFKSKSAAMNMYRNLKKMKQPISPGARLTNFLNSIFAGKSSAGKMSPENLPPLPPATAPPLTARSCLNKTPRANDSGVKRTVRFDPVGVIVGDDCRPCGHKRIYAAGAGESPAPEKHHRNHRDHRNYDLSKNVGEDDDCDDLSDSSSDLFEIDHMAFFGNGRFSDELPVYETTHLDANRAITHFR